MSSILRALKKLEKESASGERGTNKQKIRMKRDVSRRSGAVPGIYRLLTVILAVLLAGAAAWILINSTKKPAATKTRDHAIEKPVPKVLPQQPSALKKEVTEEEKPHVVSGKKSQSATQPVLTGKEQTVQPGTGHQQEPAKSVASQELTDKRNPQVELTKQTKHPEFILNGILWSDNPGRRVALINDQYLKEGDVINGATVVSIERKAVTLQAGAEKWIIRVKK